MNRIHSVAIAVLALGVIPSTGMGAVDARSVKTPCARGAAQGITATDHHTRAFQWAQVDDRRAS